MGILLWCKCDRVGTHYEQSFSEKSNKILVLVLLIPVMHKLYAHQEK